MTIPQFIYTFLLGGAAGFALAWGLCIFRAHDAETRALRAEKRARAEHLRRLDQGIAYDDRIEQYERDLDDYRREYRDSVRTRLEADQ